MATLSTLFFAALILSLFTFALADDVEHTPPTTSNSTGNPRAVVVQGLVYCQACAARGSRSLVGATPLPGAKVGVTCRDYKRRVTFYNTFPTDARGYFYAPLDGLDLDSHQMDSAANACKARLVSSPEPRCNQLTNTGFGINGALLRYERVLYNGTEYESDLFTTGPFAFRPFFCPRASRGRHH